MHKLKNRGMTLIEVAVTLAVVSIILGISLHSFVTAFPRIHLNSASRDLVSNLQKTKLEAMKRNLLCTVTFNLEVGGVQYDYVVYADANQDLEYDAGEEILCQVRFQDYGSGVEYDTTEGGGDGLTFTNNDDGFPSVAFNPRGLPIKNGGGFESGSIFIKNEKDYKKEVVVSLAGRVMIK